MSDATEAASCACLNLRAGRANHPDGTCSDFWACADCGDRFVKERSLRADLARVTAERDQARQFATDLSKKAGCWQHGSKPDEFCPNCGAMGAVVERAEKAESERDTANMNAARLERELWEARKELAIAVDSLQSADSANNELGRKLSLEASRVAILHMDLGTAQPERDRLKVENEQLRKELTASQANEAALRRALEQIHNPDHDTFEHAPNENDTQCQACIIEKALASPSPGAGLLEELERLRKLVKP